MTLALPCLHFHSSGIQHCLMLHYSQLKVMHVQMLGTNYVKAQIQEALAFFSLKFAKQTVCGIIEDTQGRISPSISLCIS